MISPVRTRGISSYFRKKIAKKRKILKIVCERLDIFCNLYYNNTCKNGEILSRLPIKSRRERFLRVKIDTKLQEIKN